MAGEVRVLIADDSPTFRQMLTTVINVAPDMRVVGEATNGHQAVTLTRELRPDVILMDVVMPQMNGLEATQNIMHATPTPIVMVSGGLERWETDIAFQAVSMGALAALRKPAGPQSSDHVRQVAELVSALRAMSSVRVIHHWKRAKLPQAVEASPSLPPRPAVEQAAPPEIIAIVASTGGPGALGTILRALPATYALPLIIAQHITPDFMPALADWLGRLTPLPIQVAQDGERPLPGRVYLAPGDAHLSLTRGGRFDLDRRAELSRYMPSGDVLLESVARSYGSRAVGVVLTGMGDDGAHGIQAMHNCGALTVAQDEATSVVYGMPRAATACGAVRHTLPLQDIARLLAQLSSPRKVRDERLVTGVDRRG